MKELGRKRPVNGGLLLKKFGLFRSSYWDYVCIIHNYICTLLHMYITMAAATLAEATKKNLINEWRGNSDRIVMGSGKNRS